MKSLHILILLFFIGCLKSWGQSTYEAGTIAQINITKDLPKNWTINFKIEPRQVFSHGYLKDSKSWDYEYDRTDYEVTALKKISSSTSIAGGLLIRFQEDKVIPRFIQQIFYNHKIKNLPLSHRFVLDQTLPPDKPTQWRIRYRASLQIPLEGTNLDEKEWYTKFNNEYLLIMQHNSSTDIEIRTLGALGYNFPKKHKLELGIDYRVNKFAPSDTHTRNQLMFYTGLFFKL